MNNNELREIISFVLCTGGVLIIILAILGIIIYSRD